MRPIPVLIALCVLATACDPTSSSEGGPTLTDHTLSYWAAGNAVQAFVTATSPAGPVTIACHGTVLATVVDTAAVDTLSLLLPLGDRSRSAGINATLDCVASAGNDSTPFILSVDDPGLPDAAPVFDTLLVQSYVQPDTAGSFTVGIRLVAHDDFKLQQLVIERSDSAACPCSYGDPMVINSPGWVGSIFQFVYDGPGTYYFRFTLTDDAGHTTSAWRGPLQVPLP